MNLFSAHQTNTHAPLADRLRPKTLAEVVGQSHLVGENGMISRVVASAKPTSIILWGPPGCGKTTIARLYAKAFDAEFIQISAVLGGVADIKKAVASAQDYANLGRRTVLFVDEVHRFNKSQQDAFLPYVEDGTFIFIGATTENPSFELNAALLSRAQVLTLKDLDETAMQTLLSRAEEEVGAKLPLDDAAREQLIHMAAGDGRYLLGMAETLFSVSDKTLTEAELKTFLQKRAAIYDKAGEAHYNLISVLHKAVRGSDVDGALFWFSRMLEGGEDPRYIARRMIRMAVEDIGLADPQAIVQTEAAAAAYERLGSPEGELALAQALVYLASAPKSNAVYHAFKSAKMAAQQHSSAPAPFFARNAPTKLMKQEGYGEGYMYDHDYPNAVVGQNFFPENVKRQNFYTPVERGFERDIAKRLAFYEKSRNEFKKK